MPPLTPVRRLENLCTTAIASHLLDVFSSWYTAKKVIIPSHSEEEYNSSLGHTDIYTLKGEFALDNCYSCDICPNVQICGHDIVEKNEALLNILTEGVSSLQKVDKTDKKYVRNRRGLVPVPIQHETETPTTVWLTNQMKHYINCNIFWPVIQDILSTLLDLIAQKVEIPRPTEKTRCYDEDVRFINFLSFLLRVSVASFLSKTVNTLDFSSVSHLVYRWKVLCKKGVTLNNGRKVDSSYFDIFGYALDITLPELRTLKYLKVPHCVHDNLVRKVAFLCPSLETLILRCSPDCTRSKLIPSDLRPSIKQIDLLSGNRHSSYKCQDGTKLRLRGCRNLVTLKLPQHFQTGNIDRSVFKMLSNMHDLRCLVGAPMIGIYKYVQNCNCILRPTKLTNFHHEKFWKDGDDDDDTYYDFEDTDDDDMLDRETRYAMFSDIFPHVREFWMNSEYVDIDKVLKCFLNADKVAIYNCVVLDLFEERFKNLTSVNMEDVGNLLDDLRHSCPNLEELTLRCGTLPELEYNSGERGTFPSLHTLRFHDMRDLEGDDLLAVLSVCPGLLCFELAMVFEPFRYFDDDAFVQLDMATFQRALPYLKKLHKFVYRVGCFTYDDDYNEDELKFAHSLTMDSLGGLIACCPDLKYVSRLSNWDVTLEEITALKEEAKASNWDLEIVWK